MQGAFARSLDTFDETADLTIRWVDRWRVFIVCDQPRSSEDIREALMGELHVELVSFSRIHRTDWSECDGIVIDAWQRTAQDIAEIAAVIAQLSHLRKPMFLSVGPSVRMMLARMGMLTSINTFARPIVPEFLADTVSKLLSCRQDTDAAQKKTRDSFLSAPVHREALLAADEALDRIFSLGIRPDGLDRRVIDKQTDTIIGSLAESGIGSWIPSVRQHHDSTYQHCLLVTGVAIAFGHQLGFPRDDLRRIALGALMHDIGKAKVPIAILDKPAALTPEERAIIQRHPAHGVRMVEHQPEITQELRDIILSHHEYLDGSGYPNGLMANSLSDIVRLVTVADVFGALIERRSYKSPLTGAEAYDILLGMNGRLDMAIVRAVKETAFTALG